jgi:lipopolysaccharide export system permease protein
VIAVVTFTVWLAQTLRFTDIIVQKGLPIASLFKLSVLILPEVLTVVLPFGFLLATLFVFYRMEGDNELIVFRATGNSNLDITRPVFLAAGILALVGALLTIIVVPHANQLFVKTFHKIRNTTPSFYIQDRQFLNFDKLTVYVRKAQKGKLLQGLLIHDLRKGGSTITAREGVFFRKNNHLQMTLYDGVRHEKDPETHQPTLLTFEQYDVVLNDKSETRGVTKVNVHGQTTKDLLAYPPHLHPYFTFNQAYAELHKRILTPTLILLFGLFASLSMLLGPVQRSQRYEKAFIGVILSVVTQVALIGIFGLAKRQVWINMLGYIFVGGLFLVGVSVLANPLAYMRRWWRS